MLHSTDRIRTTHVGSLARPPELLDLMQAAAQGRPVDAAELAEAERQAVTDVVGRQRAAGLDMISDGEQTKTGFYAYIGQRLSGFEPRARAPAARPGAAVLMPGVISHATSIVEHPEVIADRIVRFAELVGRENVVASADCGFSSQATYRPEIHPTIVWAKFEALAEGARRATARLW
jgi:methionine synthase II (cobalamin-independent)